MRLLKSLDITVKSAAEGPLRKSKRKGECLCYTM